MELLQEHIPIPNDHIPYRRDKKYEPQGEDRPGDEIFLGAVNGPKYNQHTFSRIGIIKYEFKIIPFTI